MSAFILSLIEVCRAAEQKAAEVVEAAQKDASEWSEKLRLAKEQRGLKERALSEVWRDAVITAVHARSLWAPPAPPAEDLEALEELKKMDAEVELLEKRALDAVQKEQDMKTLLTHAAKFFSEATRARGLDPFDILGLDQRLPAEEWKTASKKSWKHLSMRFHADKTRVSSGTFDALMELVSTAYKIFASERRSLERMTALELWLDQRNWEKAVEALESTSAAREMRDEDYCHEELEGPTQTLGWSLIQKP